MKTEYVSKPIIRTLIPLVTALVAAQGINANAELIYGVSDQLDELYHALDSLNKIEKALVTLYLEDLSYEEMAEVLGITESNVGVRLNRVRKHLAEQMKGVCHEF